MKNSRLATAFISGIAISGLAILGGSILKMQGLHPYEFLALLILGAVTSRTKIKLPGIDGTMSVNLPFLLIAAAQLSLFEAVMVALVSATLQSLPKRGGQLQPAKMLFNASTMVLSAGVAALLMHNQQLIEKTGPAALIVACSFFFLMNTLPVASIIAITEGSKMTKIWMSIFHLSFPYYVACTGVTSMVTVMSRHLGWQAPLAVLPVTLLMYVCYQRSFQHTAREMQVAGLPAPLARAAVAAR